MVNAALAKVPSCERKRSGMADYLRDQCAGRGEFSPSFAPATSSASRPVLSSHHSGNRATLLSRRRFKFDVYLLDGGETQARQFAEKQLVRVQESLRSLLDMVGLGKQQVGGISQPRGAVDHKGSLERQPIDRQHIGQIAQELSGIDFAKARCNDRIDGLFGASEPSGTKVYNVHPKVLLRDTAQRGA
jgi:hypothetical protein